MKFFLGNYFAGIESPSPSISPNPMRSLSIPGNMAPVPPPKPGTMPQAPPTLMPRRASAGGAPGLPPPLPLVGPPGSSRQPALPAKPRSIVSQSSASIAKSRSPLAQPLSLPRPPDQLSHSRSSPNFEAVQEKAVKFMYKDNKLLNRSYSDAYTKQSGSRIDRERKSLESGSAPVSAGVAGHLSTSNRSLPTMGVSMLGKKKISNVSTDSQAIEQARAQFERQTIKSEGCTPNEPDPLEPDYLEPQD